MNRADDPGTDFWAAYMASINTCVGGGGGGTTGIIVDSNRANNGANARIVTPSSSWKSSTSVSGYWGSGYYVAPTAAVSDATTFEFQLAADGEKEVFALVDRSVRSHDDGAVCPVRCGRHQAGHGLQEPADRRRQVGVARSPQVHGRLESGRGVALDDAGRPGRRRRHPRRVSRACDEHQRAGAGLASLGSAWASSGWQRWPAQRRGGVAAAFIHR